MTKTIIRLATALALASGGMAATLVPATAQTAGKTTPKPIKQHKAWGAYSYQDAKAGKICYILSIPTDMQPTDRNHGDVFFLISQKPDGSKGYEPQFEVGYPLKSDADISVTVDGTVFPMFSQGNNAWLKDVASEPKLIAAMRAGRSMKVAGQSTKGTNTTYTYSLSGVTAALSEVAACK